MSRKRVAVLISGRGSNMSALIEPARDPKFPAEISLVVSNVPGAGGLAAAQTAGIPAEVVDHLKFGKDRNAFEHELHAVLVRHRIEIVCLAGFMRLLTADFIAKWNDRLLNIHPALLPSFRGLHTHERALQTGVTIHGATVHFVAPEMDAGPIVIQGAVAVRNDDTPDTLAARVLAVEHRIYPQALRLVAEGRVSVKDGRCIVSGATIPDDALIAPRPD